MEFYSDYSNKNGSGFGCFPRSARKNKPNKSTQIPHMEHPEA